MGAARALRVVESWVLGRAARAGMVLLSALVGALPAQALDEPARRQVQVGVYTNEPKVFVREDGRAAGIFVDVLDALATAEGWSLLYVPCEWAECLRALERGEIDLMPDVAFSNERSGRFDFHRIPVLQSWSQIYTRPGPPLEHLPQVGGKRVAMLDGSIQHETFAQLAHGFGLSVEIVPAESMRAVFEQVRAGEADAALVNNFFGDYSYREFGLAKTPIVLQAVDLFFATARGRNRDLLEAIDRRLGAWRLESGSPYYAALARWMGPGPAPFIPAYLAWALGGAIGLLALAIGLALLLRRQVRARTRHLVEARVALERAQRLEAVGRLAGGVAHDFNNLVSVILNYTTFVLDRLSASDPNRADLEAVRQAGERAAALTRELLAVGRRQILAPRSLSLDRVVAGIEGMVRGLLSEGIELVRVSAGDLGCVEADPGQLERVVVNLALNARDAMPRGGRLTLETTNAELEPARAARHPGARPGPYVMLAVSDTGTGMDAATLDRLFEPFFTTKEQGRGTGLGLATVHGIVAQSRGFIEVESAPGCGTTFRIFLPRVDAPVA